MIYRVNYQYSNYGYNNRLENSILIEASGLADLELKFDTYRSKRYRRAYLNMDHQQVDLAPDGEIKSIIVEGIIEKI